jgi:hypothetical protein
LSNVALCQERLDQWLDGLRMPRLDDPERGLEESSLTILRNFFVLLLASQHQNLPRTPVEALEAAGGLAHTELYRQGLSLPLRGSPDDILTAIKLGPPSGELFELQKRLMRTLDDQGHELIVQLARLF